MKYKSHNREKQCIKVIEVRRKYYRQRDDFLHKQSRQIANAYDCVCVKEPDNGVSNDFGWSIFKFLLQYKLLEIGKMLISADDKMLYSSQAV